MISLKYVFGDDIEYQYSEYIEISLEKMREVYVNLGKDILGQE